MEEQNCDYRQIYKIETPQKTGKRGIRGFKIWLVVLLCIAAFGLIIGLAVKSLLSDSVAAAPAEPYVGVLYVEGVIARGNVDSWGRAVDYQHDFTLDAIDDLIGDTNNKALILWVDSPGGGVYESDELYFKIKEYRQSTGRPVFSYMASMAASGGYYIAAPSDAIFANRNCWTGSIGVTIGTLYDISGFLEKHGVDTVTITSGKNKSMGSMVDPLTDEQRKIFQSLVDEAYEQFIGIVAEERQMDISAVRKLADGRIYTAAQAEELGLVDTVASYEELLSYMADEFGLEGALIHDIIYYDNSFMGRLLGRLPLPNGPASEAEAVLSLIHNEVNFPVSYLCEVLKAR